MSPAGVLLVVEDVAGGILVRRRRLRDVAVLAGLVVDHVRGVVGDDVEEDLHPLAVGQADQLLHVRVGAQVRVDLGEVGDPVAVVPGADVGAGALHRPVLERRGQPDGRRTEGLDVVELLDHAGQVAAVVEALVRRVEPGGQAVAAQAAGVVGLVAVGEPVRHHEVEPLLGQVLPQARRRQRLVGRRHGPTRQVDRLHRDQVAGVVVAELRAWPVPRSAAGCSARSGPRRRRSSRPSCR